MGQFVQVGGHVPRWVYPVRGIGPLVLVLSLVLFWQDQAGWGVLLATVAILWQSALEVYLLRKYFQRRYIQDTAKGFIYRDRRGERHYTDAQVTAYCLFYHNHFSQGVQVSQTRHFLIWVEGDSRPLRLENKFELHQGDSLLPLIEGIIAGLLARAEQTLSRGGEVQGDRWQLTASDLTIERGRYAEPIRLTDLAAADVFESQLCLWRRGDELPLVRFPIQSRNAQLLMQLLDSRIQRRAEKELLRTGGLGRILFERRQPPLHRVVAALPAALGAFLIFGGLFSWEGESRLSALVAGAIFGTLGALLVWYFYVERFRCHELGVHKAGLFGQRNLYYRCVSAFTYAATRHLVNGSYSHTSLTMRFDPLPEAGATMRPIKYNANIKNIDNDLDALRDHISNIIALRMAEQLAAGRSVRWTSNLTLHPAELEYRPKRMLGGRKAPERIPYAAISGFNVENGTFWIWQQGEKKAIMQEQIAEPNFFPGFMLLMSSGPQSAKEPTATKPKAT